MTDDREYSTSQDVVDAPDIVAKVVHLEANLSFQLHLVRASLNETCHQVSPSKEMIDWIRVSWVMYARCSGDLANERRCDAPPNGNMSDQGLVWQCETLVQESD
jgi:hypothetical protein